MEALSLDSTSRKRLGMSKTMRLHVDNQHKGSAIKDEDEDLVCYLLMTCQEDHHNYHDLHKINEIPHLSRQPS